MISFIYTGKTQVLKDACTMINKILAGTEYHLKMQKIEHFSWSDDGHGNKMSGTQVDAMIQMSHLMIKINEYRTFWPWSRVNGYTTSKDNCYFNLRKLTNDPSDMVGTLAHEMIHCLNFEHPEINIGHGDNYYSEAKETSAPYESATIAYNIAEYLSQ